MLTRAKSARTTSTISHTSMRGFTILELVIVVLIVGIVVMLGMPQLTASITDARLNAVISEIATAVEFAQLSAMSSGRACRLTFDADTETFLVEQLVYKKKANILDVASKTLAEAFVESSSEYMVMEYPMKPGTNYSVDFTSSDWFGGIDIVAVVYSTGSDLVFDESGSPSCQMKMAVGYGGRQVVLYVAPLTGEVTTSE